jgi:uncharacterized protein YqeY
MTALGERLDQAFKKAIAAKQAVALSTLRLLKSAIRYREKELKRPLTEAELQATINTQVKQRREAMVEYTKGGRPDLAQKEEEELSILLSFLPPQLTPQEIEAEVSRIIQELGATGPKDLGKVMKSAMALLAGRADGKMVQETARQRLGS